MSDARKTSGCGCAGGGLIGNTAANPAANTPTGATTPDAIGKVLQANVAQSYDATFNVRIVPGRSLNDSVARPGCKPRGNRTGWSGVAISPGLLDTLAQADKPLVAWLARDKANAQRFLADPMAALSEAGVTLDRAQSKELARLNGAARATQVVPPGVAVKTVDAQAFAKGRVGNVGTTSGSGPGAAGGLGAFGTTIDKFACLPKRKV